MTWASAPIALMNASFESSPADSKNLFRQLQRDHLSLVLKTLGGLTG
jgi:hypothetical protein